MELKISNNAKKDKQTRTAISQQSLINALLAEKQATAPTNAHPQVNNVTPVKEWGGE